MERFDSEEYEKRVENAIDWEAQEFNFDYENITEQLDELYNRN